jgi:hypothetical protein
LLEEEHASRYRDWFNGQSSKSETLQQSFDTRSDRKGVETEALHLATIGGDRVLFVGNERTSTIFVFGLEDPSNPQLFSSATNINTELTGQEAYKQSSLGDADPEELVYIPAASSPVTGKPVLLVAGAFSGTVSLYEVSYTCAANHEGQECTTSAARCLHGVLDVTSLLLFAIALFLSYLSV